MIETGDRITRKYGGFRGVDFRGDDINLSRSPDSLNVWRDYKEIESIRTRPCFERVDEYAREQIYGIFFFGGKTIIHYGNQVIADGTVLTSEANRAPSRAFAYGDTWFFMDGKNYLFYNGAVLKDIEGYVPTTSIGRAPSGGGKLHEDVNLLTGRRINTFLADGAAKHYYLDSQNIDDDEVIVKVDGSVMPEISIDANDGTEHRRYTIDRKNGVIEFTATPSKPKTDGQDNVSVEFTKTIAGYRDKIAKCTLLQVFDNRVFVSGNPEFPNTIWHCSLHDPTYFSDLDYYEEGLDAAAVNGIVVGNNALWVFREPSAMNTTVFYHTPTIDADYGKIYPSQHSSVTTGCIGRAINFNDDIVFFSNRGMEGISGDITTEQVVAHRSSLVDSKLLASGKYKDMVITEWNGYLLVFVGREVFVADSRALVTIENHAEYEWFYWVLDELAEDEVVYCAVAHDDVLYIGATSGVYTLTDMTGDLESYWTTPKDRFNAPQKLKTTNKRGCTVEATGDITLYAKTEGSEYELIGEYEDISDYFVSRIKRKKFKDIQLKFHSNTRFSLETATLECFIGGYIKR